MNVPLSMTTIKQVYDDLLTASAPIREEKRVHKLAVGYNANLDMVVNGVKVLKNLGISENSIEPKELAQIDSVEEFAAVFLYWMQNASAAERYVTSKEIFQKIVDAARAIPEHGVHIGGNAALMANKQATNGHDVLLGGHISGELKALLHPSMKLASSAGDVADEVHLILEYGKGETFGTVGPCHRANRFIIHSDTANAGFDGVAPLQASLESFGPSGYLISGFHLLESLPSVTRTATIDRWQNAAVQVPTNIAMHVELASVAEVAFYGQLFNSISYAVDSLGLNEQELALLCEARGLEVDITKPASVAKVLKILITDARKQDFKRNGLTRIHFHSLPFHLLVQIPSPLWRETLVAASAASVAATRQASGTETSDFPIDGVDLLVSLDSYDGLGCKSLVHSWKMDDLEAAVVPVLVAQKIVRTVGLGDCISSSGFVAGLK